MKMKVAQTDDNGITDDVVTKDELLLGDWTPVRNEVWQSSVLSQGAKLCYIAICSHIWKGTEHNAWPGQKRLAKMLSVSDRTIRNYLRELEAVGIIQTVQHGLTKTNTYYICKPEIDALKPMAITERKQASSQERNETSEQERSETSDKEEAVKEQTMNHHDDDGETFVETPEPVEKTQPDTAHAGSLSSKGARGAPDDYYMEIDEKLSTLGVRLVPSAVDSQLMKKLKDADVPLDLVLTTMDEVFEKNKASPTAGKIKSFNYFADAIWEAYNKEQAQAATEDKYKAAAENTKKRIEEAKKMMEARK